MTTTAVKVGVASSAGMCPRRMQKPLQLYDALGNPKKPGDKALGIGYDEDGVRRDSSVL